MTTEVHRLTDASEDEEPADTSGDELLRVTPSTKPVLVRLVLIVVAGLAAIGVFLRRPELLGDREVTNIALLATQLLVGIGVVRQLSKYVVLRHTEYVVTPTDHDLRTAGAVEGPTGALRARPESRTEPESRGERAGPRHYHAQSGTG